MSDNRSAREQAKNRAAGKPTGIEKQEKKGGSKQQERGDSAAKKDR